MRPSTGPNDCLDRLSNHGYTGILADEQLRSGYLDKTDQRLRIDSEPNQHQGENRERHAASMWDCASIRGRTFGTRRANRYDDSQMVKQAAMTEVSAQLTIRHIQLRSMRSACAGMMQGDSRHHVEGRRNPTPIVTARSQWANHGAPTTSMTTNHAVASMTSPSTPLV